MSRRVGMTTGSAMGSLAAALLLTACPGGGSKQPTTVVSAEFECHERRAEYAVQGGMMSVGKGLIEPEAGVVVSCTGAQGPRLDKWRLLDEGGKRKSSVRKLSSEEFDTFWEKIESTGWRNLSECENPGAPEGDPVYTITISNDQAEYTTTCQGRDLPFPFDRIRNELDLAAAGYDS